MMMAVIYCCLERDNDKVLKLHTNKFCYFEIGGPQQSFETK